jgi:hypothetical protein
VAWDEFLQPVLDRRRNAHPDEPPAGPAGKPPTTVAEQAAVIDTICGGRKYEGERWWEPFIPKMLKAAESRDN